MNATEPYIITSKADVDALTVEILDQRALLQNAMYYLYHHDKPMSLNTLNNQKGARELLEKISVHLGLVPAVLDKTYSMPSK